MTEKHPLETAPVIHIRGNAGDLDRYAADPVIAHLFGLILSSPMTIEEIVAAMSSIASRDIVLNHIQYFQARGIIEFAEPTKPQISARRTIPPDEISLPISRDYSGYLLADEEISAHGDLSPTIKRELVFLSKYGANLDFYKILGISPDSSDQEVQETHQRLKDFFDSRHFAGKDLGRFAEKLSLAQAIIERAGILCDPEKRKKYDRLLVGEKEGGKHAPSVENEKTSLSQKRKAEEYYAKATFLAAQDSFETIRNALSLAKEALALDPQNREYKAFLQKLEKINKKHKINAMFASLEQGDFELFDGERLKKEIGKLLDLAGHTAEVHLRLARLLMDKGLLMVARKLARQSKQIDPEYTAAADQLLQKIDQVLDYYKRSGKVIREQ